MGWDDNQIETVQRKELTNKQVAEKLGILKTYQFLKHLIKITKIYIISLLKLFSR